MSPGRGRTEFSIPRGTSGSGFAERCKGFPWLGVNPGAFKEAEEDPD